MSIDANRMFVQRLDRQVRVVHPCPLPDEWGAVVGMVEFGGRLIVATQFGGVHWLDGDKLQPIPFVTGPMVAETDGRL